MLAIKPIKIIKLIKTKRRLSKNENTINELINYFNYNILVFYFKTISNYYFNTTSILLQLLQNTLTLVLSDINVLGLEEVSISRPSETSGERIRFERYVDTDTPR